ncbi:glycosyltransferase [Aestuariirhabdus sp. LZHN29]|uniref:glycosyltransferase n=1 Tax=Aestuariirhabdus sp. LZHN29 TaxID=3417462 RepID=UPI003CE6DE84
MIPLLVLTTTYPRWKSDVEPAFVHQLSKRLTDAFTVHVIAPWAPGSALVERMDGVQIHRFRYFPARWGLLAYDGGIVPSIRRHPWMIIQLPFFAVAMLLASLRVSRKYRVTLVHAHWIVPGGIIALLLKLLRGGRTRILLTSHGADLYALTSKFWKKLQREVINRVDQFTVVSRSMADHVASALNTNKLARIEPMGIDAQQQFTSKRSWGDREGIVFVGRLVEKKGVNDLLDAYARIAADYDIKLTLVGDGPERGALAMQAIQLGVKGRVTFLGAVPSDNVGDYFNHAKIAVMPSIVASDGDQEGLGLVAGEAICSGCIGVVSNLSAINDVHDESLLQFQASNVDSLEMRLRWVLENEAEARSLTIELRKRIVKRFDWAEVANRYEAILDDLVET